MVLAKEIDDGDECQNSKEHAGCKTTPNEPPNQIFSFKIECTPGTTTRIVLQHVSAISTGLVAHECWSIARWFIER